MNAPMFPVYSGRWPDSAPTAARTESRGLLPQAAAEAPRTPWDVFMRSLDWQQGEHVGLIGPTGQGKTTLLTSLLPLRTYVAVLATKPRDVTMDRLIASGYERFDDWQSIPAHRAPRRVIWPSAMEIDAEDSQKRVFERTYSARFGHREGRWVFRKSSPPSDPLGCPLKCSTRVPTCFSGVTTTNVI